MDIKVSLKNSGSKNKNRMNVAADVEPEISQKTREADHAINDSQELLLKAQKDAELAKAIARQAISQAFKQSEASVKRAETLARAFDDALQGSVGPVHHEDKDDGAVSLDDRSAESGLAKKSLNNSQNPLNAISDVTESFFTNNTIDVETRKDFYDLVIRQSQQLRELVNDLVEQQSRKRIKKALEEAKSDRIASKLAVQQAQDELKKIRKEAEEAVRQAQEEARNTRSEVEASRKDAEEAINIAREWVEQVKNETMVEKKAAEVMVSQAQQQAVSQAAVEVKKAKNEVEAAREAASIAVKRAEVEINKIKKEAEEARNQAQVRLALAQEQARQETEKVEVIRQQLQVALEQALSKAAKAEEEVKITRRESQQAINRAREESRKAIEEVELVKRKLQETIIQAQQQTYQDVCGEMKKIKEEAEITKKAASEAIVRAQEETRKAQEESRKAKEKAEANILMANEAMKRARQDIIDTTIGEITRTRQELEAANKAPRMMLNTPQPAARPAAEEPEPSGQVDGKYITSVLREMRAPLHSISGFASLMLEDGVSDIMTQKEFLSIVVRHSESLNRLLDDLSGLLSPNNSETFSIDKEPVSPHKLITEAVQGAQGMALQKKNVIILSIPNTLPEIKADGERIKQVLLNLIANAIKFSSENNAIVVRAEVRDSELLIQVKDHGVGIPLAEMPAIFEQNCPATNRGNVKQHGPGLHICKEVVEAHGGRIWAESLEGQGSTFSLTLPLVPAVF